MKHIIYFGTEYYFRKTAYDVFRGFQNRPDHFFNLILCYSFIQIEVYI